MRGHRIFGFLIGVAFAVLAIGGEQNASADSTVIDAPTDGVEIGLGWDGRRARLVPNRCINFAPIQEGGQETTVSLSEVSDASELRKHLGVSVSASIHGIGGGGSASAEFVENAKIKSSSTNFSIRAKVVNGAMFVGAPRPPAARRYAFTATERKPELDGEAASKPTQSSETVHLSEWVTERFDLTTLAGRDAFQRYCGDAFVSAIYSGVELFSVIQFDSQSKDSDKTLKAAVEASYGFASGSAGFDAKTESLATSSNMRMSFLQRGGAGGIIPAGREQLVRKLEAIAREAIDAPKFFEIRITPYSDLPDWPTEPILVTDDQKSVFVHRYLQLKTLYTDLQDVIDDGRGAAQRYDRCFAVAYYEALQDNVSSLMRIIESTQSEIVANDWSPVGVVNKQFARTKALGLGITNERRRRMTGETPEKNDTAPTPDLTTWLDRNLSVAYLKILLPPLMEGEKSLCADNKPAYQTAVIDQYIRPMNTRLCTQRVTDPECLSNAAIAQLHASVAYPSTLTFKIGDRGYLCSAGPFPVRRCVAWHRSSQELQLTSDISKAAIVEVKKAKDGISLVVEQAGADGAVETASALSILGRTSHRNNFYFVGRKSKKGLLILDVLQAPGAPQGTKMLRDKKGIIVRERRAYFCLFARAGTNEVLAQSNNCKFPAKYVPSFSWNLYAPLELGQ